MISEIVGIVCASWFFWFMLDYLNHRDAPPGPMRFPIIGNLLQLALADRVSNIALHKISKVYGDLVTLKMGMVDVLLISSHKIYVDMYTRNDTLERTTEGCWLKDRTLSQDLGIATSTQKPWEIIRKFLAKSLHKFGFANRSSMEKLIIQELESLVEYMETEIRTNGTGIIHFHSYFAMSLVNLITHLVLGKRYPYENKELQSIVHSTEKYFKVSIHGTGLITAYPFLRFIFPNALGYNTQMECIKEGHNFARLHLKRQMSLETGAGASESNAECFLKDFVRKMKEEKDNPETIFTEDQFVVCFVDLLQGGSETTGSYLEYAILLLITHPEVQEKLYQEILVVIGEKNCPSMTDFMRMDYTRAVIMEIHRFAKIATTIGPRIVTQDFTYGNYKIKKGTMLIANQYSMYGEHDSNGEEAFRPERFISGDGKFLSSLAERIAPFGAGKRICLGESLAVDSIFLYLTTLVQKFSFKFPDLEDFPDLKPLIGLTARPRPFNAKVKCRF